MKLKIGEILRIWPLSLTVALFVPSFFFVWIPHRILASTNGYNNYNLGVFRYIGLFSIILGLVVFIWCVLSFAFLGKGSPAPFAPPKKLVVRGLYRYVRNPMYIGWLLILAGEVLLSQSIELFEYFLITFGLLYFFILFYEEPRLANKFGESYERYRKSVRRWIPRLTPYREDSSGIS